MGTIESIIAGVNDLTFSEAEEAINQLTAQGITKDSELPFLRIIYNHAEKELCQKLGELGCPFIPEIIGTYLYQEGNVYAIYNPDLFDYSSAIEWIKVSSESV